MPLCHSVPQFLQSLGSAIAAIAALPITEVFSDLRLVRVLEDDDARNTGFEVGGTNYELPLNIWTKHYVSAPGPNALYEALAR